MAAQHGAVTLRPMRAPDFDRADEVWRAAFATSTEFPQSSTPPTATERLASNARRAHFLRHDPGGSFVALVDDTIVGVAQSHRREGTFVLAMLAVAPEFQDAGIGRDLLDASLAYSRGAKAAYIFSSSDPRAIHRYLRAGFRLHPAVQITGRVLGEVATPGSIRVSSGEPPDLAYVESIDRALRGSGRSIDVALLIHEHDGYAVLTSNRLAALGALEEPVARELFAAVLAGHPDGVLRSASWIAGQQQWAIEEATRQRATIEVRGSIMTRDVAVLPEPYLPNGLFG
jgi:predicted N-acetyltransferase YhbS